MRSGAWMSKVREHRTLALLIFDLVAVSAAYLAFGLFRYGPFGFPEVVWHLVRLAVAAGVLQTALGLSLRVYQGRTVVASSEDTVRLGAAVVAAGLTVSAFNALTGEQYVSRIVPAGATFLAFAAVLFGRLWWRTLDLKRSVGEHEAARALIFGAGSAGRQLARSMVASPAAGMRPSGSSTTIPGSAGCEPTASLSSAPARTSRPLRCRPRRRSSSSRCRAPSPSCCATCPGARGPRASRSRSCPGSTSC